jgi:dipeptidyl-peptidase-4
MRSAAVFALLLCAPAAAQDAQTAGAGKPLSLDVLYDPASKVDFAGTAPRGLTWLDETRLHWPKTDPKSQLTDHFVIDADTGVTRPLFDPAVLEASLARVPGVTADQARDLAREKSYVLDKDARFLVLEAGGDLHRFELASSRLTRLTTAAGKEEEPAWSPDSRRIAFVRNNDLYAIDVATGREERLTSDGSPDTLNGKLDWVYQEEIYGRGIFKAHWWSPDSSAIAYLQLDERGVPRFTLVDEIAEPLGVEVTPYPRPGEGNPKVRLGIVRIGGGTTRWVDLAPYSAAEPLVVDVAWTPDGQVAYQVQDREQTWLDLNLADGAGRSRKVLRETTRAWVESHGSPHWLKDGTFLWLSERDGWKHVYHVGRDGSVIRQLTRGEWEARTLHGADERAARVYFSGTERSPIGGDLYRVQLDGSGLTRLSQRAGTHVAAFPPSMARYVDAWSDLQTPPQVRIHAADGTEARVIDAKPVAALAEYRLRRPELIQVKTRDGFVMEAMLIKPPDFDPSRRYPVLQSTYAGPHAPRVKNAWGDTAHLFLQLIAQRGVLVWVCDNRTASGKGAVSAWHGYKRMGVTELEDIEDGLDWLRRQPFVDPARIGIEGWSYGGFMVSYALTHSRSFAMGIAGGPVTDWRLYDSVYTERYMGLPARNEAGYASTAPRRAAAALHGRLLLVHGAIDDNVHPQNTLQLAHELQKAGKPFRMMLYPKSRHGVTDPAQLRHLRGLMLDYIEETLLAVKPAT